MSAASGSFDTSAASALWWPVVSQARWFQGKSRGGSPRSLTPLPWLVDTADLRVRPELLTVSYGAADGAIETYQLLVAYRPSGCGGPAVIGTLDLDAASWDVSDATRDPEAMAAVLPAVAQDRVYGTGHGPTLVATYSRPMPDGDLTPRVFTGEQSNTNVLYGDTALLKVFRKLEPGANLDRELTGRLLAGGVSDVPVLYGWLAVDTGDGEPDDLMMLTELLPDPVDGWGLATDAAKTDTRFDEEAAALGRALGQIHAALAADHATVAGDDVADQMEARLTAAVEAAPALTEHEPALRTCFEALRGQTLPAQPVHGDFHLGQTLSTPLGWRIIDFEGEPLKSMAERRRPDSPLRDVAGMLRSLSYATSAADDPHGTAATEWLQSAREAFLRAYRETAGSSADETVLAAYEADKAAYEVVYETRNRPDWVHIPLGAIAALTTPNDPQRS